MDIANVIKDLRASQHWEQEDLAKRLGTSQQTVSNWEAGTMPRASALTKINALLKEIHKPTISLVTLAIKANERSTGQSPGMLVILQGGKQKGLDRLLAVAAKQGMATFVATTADQAADLIEKIN